MLMIIRTSRHRSFWHLSDILGPCLAGAIQRHLDARATQGRQPDRDAAVVVGRRGGLRLQDRLHHRAHHHGLAGPRGRGHRRLLLAHGLQEAAQDSRAAAPPARVPQPALHDAGTSGRTDPWLPSLMTSSTVCDVTEMRLEESWREKKKLKKPFFWLKVKMKVKKTIVEKIMMTSPTVADDDEAFRRRWHLRNQNRETNRNKNSDHGTERKTKQKPQKCTSCEKRAVILDVKEKIESPPPPISCPSYNVLPCFRTFKLDHFFNQSRVQMTSWCYLFNTPDVQVPFVIFKMILSRFCDTHCCNVFNCLSAASDLSWITKRKFSTLKIVIILLSAWT